MSSSCAADSVLHIVLFTLDTALHSQCACAMGLTGLNILPVAAHYWKLQTRSLPRVGIGHVQWCGRI